MRVTLDIPEGQEGRVSLERMGAGWRWRGPRHQHEELELNLVRRGRASVLVNRRRQVLTPGTLLWLFPDEPHMVVETTPDFAMYVAVFSPRLVRRHCGSGARRVLRERRPAGGFCRRLSADDRAKLARHLEELEKGGDAGAINAGLAWCLVDAWRAFEVAEEPGELAPLHPAVERAARHLAEATRAGDEATLPELARMAGLSPWRLSRLFRAQVGVPLSDFRNRLRVERFTATYEPGGRLNLTEAAYAAGFTSYPQFYRACVRFLGVPPAAYRRKVGDGV